MKPMMVKPAAPEPVQPKRMTLAAVTRGKQEQPVRVVMHGIDGVGKTTFAANAPKPIFIGAERGTSQQDVARFPVPERWQDIRDAVRTLTDDEHDFKTLALDSLDWAEPLLFRDVCIRAKASTIEEVGGGWGKGYTAALDDWRILLSEIERLQAKRGMHVVFIAHSLVKSFKNPAGEDYDRYQIKVNDKAAGLIREWADDVLFANYEVIAAKDERTKRVRGVDTGARIIHTVYSAAWDAKNRHSLEPSLPLSWDDYFAGVKANQSATPDELRKRIAALVSQLAVDEQTKAAEAEKRAGDDAAKLSQLVNWINARIGQKEQQS